MSSSKVSTSPVPSLKTVSEHALLSTLMALIMLLAYLGGFHKPAIHDLDIAIVTDNAQTSVALQQKLNSALGDGLHIRSLASEDEAQEQLKNRQISGAYMPQKDHATLLLASADSGATAETLTKVFQKATQQQGIPLLINDVVPTDENDPIGQNIFFYLVALSVGSYATSIAIAAAGAMRAMRDRITLAAGAAIAIPTVFLFVSYWLFGLFDGHLRAAWALSVLYSAAVLFVGVGLRPIVGHYCTLLYATLFVGLNFTSSGGVFSPDLQPTFFQILHHFWIGAGFVETMRNITYFPTVSIANPLTVLIAWLVAGLVCLAIGGAYERRQKKLNALISTTDGRARHTAAQNQHQLPDDVEEELEENVAPA